jgi:cobalt/nickel transport system permease protein
MLLSPVAMHIPDGFLSVVVSIIAWMISILLVGYALKRVNEDLGERHVPLMGVLAAAIFAGQMLNFTVATGTSGHLMGAALATVLVGPWSAIIVMTSVVSIQALVFQDGGLLVLGANILNMGIIGVAVAHFAYQSLQRVLKKQAWGPIAAGVVAAWLSIFVAALACALQLAVSGKSPANLAIPAMGGIHALIGIGEGLITAGALLFIRAARPDLLSTTAATGKSTRAIWVGGLLIAVALAVLSPLASAHPDGLEWVAEQQGFMDVARKPLYNIIPEYGLPGVSNEALATMLAGIIGVGLVLAATVAVTRLRRQRATA